MEKRTAIENEFLSAVNSLNHAAKVLLAVSGGADSMAMLSLCMKFFPSLGIPFSVITINHNIRNEVESSSDALFVSSFCNQYSIRCVIKNIEKGMISKLAFERQKGIEEAARVMRYDLFSSTALELDASHIFLAHTKNDQLETLIQRFFQGSSSSLYGIIRERRPYFRPLLGVDRKDIEAYLSREGISFCTDSTNYDTSYLRNRIRNEVIPFLSASLPGWQTGVLNGAKKAVYDADFMNSFIKNIWEKEDDEHFFTNADQFFSLHAALRIRYLYKALSLLHIDQRIPFSIIEKAAFGERCETASAAFYQKKGKLYAKKLSSTGKLQHFFGILEEECVFELAQGALFVSSKKSDFTENRKIAEFCTTLPCMAVVHNTTLSIKKLDENHSDKLIYVSFIRNKDE